MRIVQLSAIDMTLNNFLDNLNQGILDEGHEVICVCSEGPYKQEMIEKGYKVRNINIERKISPLSNLRTIRQLKKLFDELKPEVVHVHTPVASVLGRIAAKLSGVENIIYTAHGFYFHDDMTPKQYNFYLNVEKYTAKLTTDYLLTQSYEDYETAKKHRFIRDEENIICIGNGVDLDEKFNYDRLAERDYSPIYRKYNINESDTVITFIGRLVQEKGVLDLLEAFSKIAQENVKLMIIGGLPQGERDTKTGALLKQYDENPDIIFTGHINNANELLFISDIFCLPSYREGMPRSIIEAMAMKNAIIATNIRGSREEVIHGENGYLADVASPNQLLTYIEKLIGDERTLDRMKEKSHSEALKLYDENDVVDKQIEILKSIEENELFSPKSLNDEKV